MYYSADTLLHQIGADAHLHRKEEDVVPHLQLHQLAQTHLLHASVLVPVLTLAHHLDVALETAGDIHQVQTEEDALLVQTASPENALLLKMKK